MNKTTVAVFFGGHSSEYGVSLESAYSVICNLDSAKYAPVPIGISQEGKWYYYIGDLEKIKTGQWIHEKNSCIPAMLSPDYGSHTLFIFEKEQPRTLFIDVAFPVMHGKYGEDGTIQGLITLAGIPLAGCGVLSSALCMDKDRAHKLAFLAGIAVPRSFSLRRNCMAATIPMAAPIGVSKKIPADVFEELSTDSSIDILRKAEEIGYPLFVKPVKAGSSYGITKVTGKEQLLPAIDLAFSYDDEVLLEECIDGFEVGCAVMGTDNLIIGEVDEIELSGGFFDFTEKYTLKTSAIHVPARIDGKTADHIKETARTLYKALGCSGFARVDMFLTPEGRIVFNEINTIPGFTEHSRFPGMMKAAGISFSQILDTILTQALRNQECRESAVKGGAL